MELCDSGHEEIAYSSDVRCPACEVANEKDETISRMQDENDELTTKVDELEELNEKLTQQLKAMGGEL